VDATDAMGMGTDDVDVDDDDDDAPHNDDLTISQEIDSQLPTPKPFG
jgi:hypothetical protein